MTRPFKILLTAAALTAAAVPMMSANSLAAAARPAAITVQVDKPGHAISPLLYGIFYEEINCSGDGGLYAELVRNRSFENNPSKVESWKVSSDATVKMSLDTANPSTTGEFNKHSLRVEFLAENASVINEGYWGIGLNRNNTYKFSILAKKGEDFNGPIKVSLQGENGEVYASATIKGLTSEWKQYNLNLKSKKTDPKACLAISSAKSGTIWIDMVSLFPAKTWKNRQNGLRPDLADMLVGLKPSFVRFPGGCWVEGNDMSLSQRWKQTIGPLVDRRTQHNIWGYQATNGLAYHEYLQLCEDLKTEPLFVINCGMSHKENVPMDKMGEYVQDALDAIEYANGPVTSTWGALRAKNGHPKPFGLKLMEIGNENGGPAYNERWALFYNAIKSKYPYMKLIACVWGGGSPTNLIPDIVDEHYYLSPEAFIAMANKYDNYDRTGPKIYVGEYAVTKGSGKGNLRSAVGEAVFMIGMERNSDIVAMASYAPLFVNVNHRAWNPNLIDFDSLNVYGIPSYYVQKMFSENRGDVVLPVAISQPSIASEPSRGAIALGTWATSSEYKDIKVTGDDGKVLFQSDFSNGSNGWKLGKGAWKVENGALVQTDAKATDTRAIVGDPSWTNYTLTMKARKISGAEGFLVMFRYQNNETCGWLNLGGWGNSKSALQWSGAAMGKDVFGSIETGKWYDIRIEVTGTRVKAYLDNNMLYDEAIPRAKSIYVAASRENKSGDIIVKIVNVDYKSQPVQVNLAGITGVGATGTMSVLTSASGADENSIDEPNKISPKTTTVTTLNGKLEYEAPANSVAIVRFKTAK